jgi:hypothetical protein
MLITNETIKQFCLWEYKGVEEYYYEAQCGGFWEFDDGDIKENRFKYCPFCGKKILNKDDLCI